MIASARILAISPIGIGNFLLLLPALQYLKTYHPGVRLSVLSLKPGIDSIAGRYPFIDEILSINANQVQSFTAKLAFIQHLRGKFDISLSFFPANRLEYNLLPFLAGIRRRIGFRYAAHRLKTLSFLNTDLVKVSNTLHDMLQNFSALKELGMSRPESLAMLPLPLTDDELSSAQQLLEAHQFAHENLIGLHPGSSSEHGMDKKRWPVKTFAALARLIQNERNTKFLVFGGDEEKALKEALVRGIGRDSVSVETASLFETAALIGRCSRFVSNDTGLMHVATSLKVKTAGIFGPTDGRRTAPFGKDHLVIRGEFDCSPCWTIQNVGIRETCKYGDYRCLNSLSAEFVFNRLKDWL